PSTGALTYVNAGHNPPFVVHEGAVTRLVSTGKPIGILPDSPFRSGLLTLPRGATLFLYTDGLNEATNANDEELGNERLEALIVESSQESPRAMAARVLEQVTAFEAGAHANDDKTVVVVRRN
ncbi:MAG: sigma-B regulation protein RsbU (phosphoserine phosphatase), partial [Acidobacteria bacterium]|nr:sigma-B regulation protein RsbU (phosphoserine phosphatase) [Acidobacteriota bacterium]